MPSQEQLPSPIRASSRRVLIKLVTFARGVLGCIEHIGIALPGRSDEVTHARDKALAEISLLLTEIRQHKATDAELRDLCGEAIEELLSLCDFDRMIAIIYSFPQAALAFGTIAVALKTAGHEDHPLCSMVYAAIKSPFYFSTARPEFREHEALWLIARLTGDASALEAVPRTGLLFRRTHSVFLRREDMYAKTHEAMYLTDFGRRRLEGAFSRNLLATSLDHDLAWALGKADWDLVGEISTAASYCLDAPTCWQSICDAALDAVFDRFGFVPAPTFDTNYANTLCSIDRERYSRFHAYHSTIVYGLLLLAKESHPDTTPPGPHQDLEDLAPLLSGVFALLPSFSFAGGGVDPNWYLAHRSEDLLFRNDLIAEIVLGGACETAGFEAAAKLASAISSSHASSTLRDTIEVIVSHQRLFSAWANPPHPAT